MDRVSELRCAGGSASGSGDSTLDTTSPPSDAYMSANDTSSKYFSFSDSTFDISPIKDVSLASTTAEPDRANITDPDELMSNLSPLDKKDMMESYKIGKQIEAANILSGGVDIFEDNDHSFDGDELVIDDNAEVDDKCNEKGEDPFKPEESMEPGTVLDGIGSKDTEVVLQIDGNNVNAIDIGNGLYLYRKEGLEELAAVQIVDDGVESPSFKFLKVRENSEGNLEVYEEIEIEVPKDMPTKEESGSLEKSASHVPIKDNNRIITDTSNSKVTELNTSPQKAPTTSTSDAESELKEPQDTKPEVNLNGKMMKFNESRKSPVVGSFTPMTYHSTPNKEGKPLTKTMVDLQLNPSRHSDNVKKTIEVHTDSNKQKPVESQTKKSTSDSMKVQESDEILDTTEKGTDNINNIDKAVKTVEKVEVSEQNEFNSTDEAKNMEIMENKLEISEGTEIKQDVIVDELVIDEDLESNEIGELVIDEPMNEPLKTTESDLTDEKKSDDLPKTPHVTLVTDALPAPIVKCTENKNDDFIVKQKVHNTDENTDKLKTDDVSGGKDNTQNAEKADNVQSLSPKIADVQKVENTGNSTKQIIPKVENTKEILNKEKDSQKVESKKEKECQVTKSEELQKQSIAKVSLIIEDRKPIVKDTKDVTGKTLTAKKEVAVTSSSNTAPCTKTSYTNIEKINNDVSESIPDILPKINEQTNKKEDINASQNITVPKSILHKPDAKLPINEIIPATKQVTALEETVVDNKPSSSEISKSIESKDHKQATDDKSSSEVKSINNNHNPVPFGKWTEVNRQEFLNKFKEHKVPVNTNSKQIKNSNDLNRRDVLKKIDSQRQSNIASTKDKPNFKHETIFTNKLPSSKPETKIPVKKDDIQVKPKLVEPVKNVTKQEIPQKPVASSTVSSSTVTTKLIKKEATPQKDTSASATSVAKTEPTPRREVNMNDLIHKTIEDMLNKVVPMRALSDDTKQLDKKEQITANEESSVNELAINQNKPPIEESKILDDIEIKMNELHGIPFVERPPHELPKAQQTDVTNKIDSDNSCTKNIKKNDIDSTVIIPDNAIDVDSEEEVIDHEPITGDIEPNVIPKLLPQEVTFKIDEIKSPSRIDAAKKEPVITENDFDKFARRNSITYDNCKTVSIETKDTHNVVPTVKNKDISLSKNSSYEHGPLEVKSKLPLKQPPLRLNTNSRKSNTSVTEDPNSKTNQSKIHIAYQSALTSKIDRRVVERPITIIEDKPVKVVFMESTADFVPGQLNVQGQELSPIRKQNTESPKIAATDSLNSREQTDDNKQIDDHKSKTKHQRKQVLTPVETPELELIQPSDIGIDVSPKKKRKTEDNKNDKHYKNLVHKKSYLLGRSGASEDKSNYDVSKTSPKEDNKTEELKTVKINTTSALDNLVKAAELIENQSENIRTIVTPTSDSSQNTPVKRGRGRPRKTPLPESEVKELIPQKKLRLIDAKPVKDDSETDEESLDGEIVKENWTMGKINENIVCPICNKLFRSENVVFKHVKHCTGVSPNRSDSDKRSPRRDRNSQESDLKSLDSRSDMDIDNEDKTIEVKKKSPKKRKSKEINTKSDDDDKTEVIVIEDTPVKKKPDSNDNQQKEKKLMKTKIPLNSNNLVCEFCGKTFRQLSYLVNHKLQHKKDEMKKNEKDKVSDTSNKVQVFSCEVCKKEFRKLHHLVQHRVIHNTNTVPPRSLRKTSSEQNDNKTVAKDETVSKQNDESSAAFRCEPCDKSFRKLHHLVEHRETHDGINKQKVTSSTTAPASEQTPTPPQCDVCKKTFRKLHHLIEHKEQHLETSSEKSDDKSIKSVLSTKDIIHECSLCYMVFPNEQSLNKHSGNCQKKKRQSKTAKNDSSEENVDKSDENLEDDDKKTDDNVPNIIAEEIIDDEEDVSAKSDEDKQIQHKVDSTNIANEIKSEKIKEKSPQRENNEKVEQDHTKISLAVKPDTPIVKESMAVFKESCMISDNINKVEDKNVKSQTHKKKASVKDKIAPTVTKRRRTVETTMATVKEVKTAVESSDDDEVRYMFNPNFKLDETTEGRVFMKVRANKRNSLQIERPNSKDLVKRRTSLQHPPKIPRLKAKAVETKIVLPSHTMLKTKIPIVESATFTDSDDSDVKYSFPKNIPEKTVKPIDEAAKKPGRKSVVDKRKTLSGIAKRKSLGQIVSAKNNAKPSPVKTVKKRIASVEHRCDCGQLFSSAALLSRHTSLAHTPPRIRRRRSPPPAPVADRPRPASNSSGAKLPAPPSGARKSIRHDTAAPAAATPTETRKSIKPNKTESKSVTTKVRRSTTAHKGVPVPEKMRKLMQKNKK